MFLKILIVFLKIGAFSFGGGYGVLAVMQKEIIDINHWVNIKDFTDIVAIAGITPGPIAVNSSIFVGYKTGGFWGSILSTLGVILVPVALTLLVSVYFNKFKQVKQVNWALKGIRPAVLGLIAAACYNIGRTSITDIKSVIIGILVFIGIYKYKLHPIMAIAISGVLGFIAYGLLR